MNTGQHWIGHWFSSMSYQAQHRFLYV